MLRGQKEIMMLLQECSMKGNKSLPLIIGEATARLCTGLCDHNTLLLNHDETSLDALDLVDELLLSDSICLRLEQ